MHLKTLQNLCSEKATEQGIRAARLPIGTYLSELPTRKVLTVNQVFDIMLSWLEKRDWREAFWKQIPKRKFQGKGRADDVEEEVDDDLAAGGDDGADEDAQEEDADAPVEAVEPAAIDSGQPGTDMLPSDALYKDNAL